MFCYRRSIIDVSDILESSQKHSKLRNGAKYAEDQTDQGHQVLNPESRIFPSFSRYAVQFSLLFVFHTIGYILLRVLPKIFNEQQKEWRILVAFSFLLDCSANAVIYLGFNVEVRGRARSQAVLTA